MPLSSQTTHGDEADSHLLHSPSPQTAILADRSPPTPPPSSHISKQMTAYRLRHTKKIICPQTNAKQGARAHRIIAERQQEREAVRVLKRKLFPLIVRWFC